MAKLNFIKEEAFFIRIRLRIIITAHEWLLNVVATANLTPAMAGINF